MEQTEVHPLTNTVISCVFLFSKFFGREPAKVERKRKATNILQFYTPPFRTDLILKHLDGQHPEKWAEYNESTVATKKGYFAGLVARCNTLHQYWNLDSDALEFNISREIIEIVSGDLFFRPEDELASAESENEDEQISDRNRKVAKRKNNALALFLNRDYGSYTVRSSMCSDLSSQFSKLLSGCRSGRPPPPWSRCGSSARSPS
jgi:hypothetical protein